MDVQYVYESRAWPMKTYKRRRVIEDSVKDDDAPEFELRFYSQDSTRFILHQESDPPSTHTTWRSRPSLKKALKYPQQLILGDIDVLINNMSSSLTSLDIPTEYQRSIAIKIHDTAMHMVQNSGESSKTCSPSLRMAVLITTVTYFNYTLESLEESAVGGCCATASSVDALERMIIREKDFIDYDCVICMENFVAGVKVIKMPCLHVYHESCIKEWLQKRSHLCPLCRFALPRVHSSQRRSV